VGGEAGAAGYGRRQCGVATLYAVMHKFDVAMHKMPCILMLRIPSDRRPSDNKILETSL